MSKEKSWVKLTDHHILCQHPDTNTTLQWSNHPHNIIRIVDNTHRALHTLFANKMIADQLLTCVDISQKALLPEVRNWLVETLTSIDTKDPTLRYKEECIK